MHPTRPDRRAIALVAAALVVVSAGAGCGGDEERSGTPSTTSTPTSASSSVLSPVVPLTSRATATTATAPTSDPSSLPPPFIAGATWAESPYGRTVKIEPTPNGRRTDGIDDAGRAWREVLGFAPDADSPGMRAQFDCHWSFARLLEPDKPSWNIEPWRPVVPDGAMIAAGCNPGGPEV